MLKTKDGITLVALVVTIIILLILAGVSINMVFGENGIFSKTQLAAEKYKNAQEQEYELFDKIQNHIGNIDTLMIDSSGRLENNKDLFGIVNSTGKGTQNDPFIINDEKQLIALSGIVNSGIDFSGVYFKLAKDMDLSLIYGASKNKSWVPIGNATNMFKGYFDGKNHKIKNLYINTTQDNQGLFGVISSATIKNLIIDSNSSVTGGNCCGGIVGLAYNSNIEKCGNNGAISAGTYSAGIIGQLSGGRVEKCYNKAAITGEAAVGGIAGAIWDNGGNVKYCYNTGDITVTGSVYGDLTGRHCWS